MIDRALLSLWWFFHDPERIIVALVWIGIVIGVLEVERRRRRRNLPAPSAEPTCPTCGYLVVGLPGKVCPECGSDLASVGVVRRDDHRTSRVARVTLWTILFALPAFLVWREVRPRLPVLTAYTVTQTFSGPASGAYRSIEVRTEQRWWQWGRGLRNRPPSQRLKFRLQRLDNSQPVYVIEQRTRTAAERQNVTEFIRGPDPADSPRKLPKIFDRRPLVEWMRTQGVNVDDIGVQTEVDAIGDALDQRSYGFGHYGDRSPFASSPIVQAGYHGTPWWVHAACGAVALAVWLIGARLVARRRTLPYERTALPQPANGASPDTPDTRPASPGAVIER